MVKVEEVKHLAELARISISEEDLPGLVKDFDSVLAYVGQLEELTIPESATTTAPLLRNVFREDTNPTPTNTNTEKIVKAFPKSKGNYLLVKKILENPDK